MSTSTEKEPEQKQSVFVGTPIALFQRFIGGVLCIAAPGFLIVGIVVEGVRWELHAALAIFLLLCCLYLLFLLEGTQIAVVRLKEGGHIAPHVYQQAPHVATMLEDMGDDGVATYLIGRQVLVCANVYIVAALTELGEPMVSRFFTIIAGILTVVCYGQLAPQLAADIDPITFFKVPGVTFIIILSSFIAKCGVGHYSYWLALMLLGCFEKPAEVGDDDVEMKKTEKTGDAELNDMALTIFKTLGVEPHLEVRVSDKNHVPPHILLAVSLGLSDKSTQDKAHNLLTELAKEHGDHPIVKHLISSE